MEINLHQLIILCIWLGVGLAAYKVKNNKFRVAMFFLAAILFLFNPVKFSQVGGASIERSVSRFDDMPEKIEIETGSYQSRSQEEHDKLQSQSKEIQNEI